MRLEACLMSLRQSSVCLESGSELLEGPHRVLVQNLQTSLPLFEPLLEFRFGRVESQEGFYFPVFLDKVFGMGFVTMRVHPFDAVQVAHEVVSVLGPDSSVFGLVLK